jgi:hypothetical protein
MQYLVMGCVSSFVICVGSCEEVEMDCEYVDFQQLLDEVVEEEVVAKSSSRDLALAVALTWVRVMEMADESVILVATVLSKVDCADRTTLPHADLMMVPNCVDLVPVGPVRGLSCNPEMAFCMRRI